MRFLRVIIYIFLLLFAANNLDAQCLVGDCKDGFSVLMKKDTGAEGELVVTVGNFVTEGRHHDRTRLDGIVLEYELSVAGIYNLVKHNYVAKHPVDLVYVTGNNMQNMSRPKIYPNGDEHDTYFLYMGCTEYYGYFKWPMPDGHGKLEYDERHRLQKLLNDTPTLERYVGNFTNGNPDGEGRMYYSSGLSDSVTFKDGIMVSPETPNENGFKAGCHSGNCIDGWGTYVWTHSHTYKYTGVWKNGHPAGFGYLIYINGESYMGELDSAGVPHGRGMNIHYPGTMEDGIFEHGDFTMGYYNNDEKGNYLNMIDPLAKYDGLKSNPEIAAGICTGCHGKGVVVTANCKSCKGSGYRRVWGYRANDEIVKTDIHNDGSRTIYYNKQGSYDKGYECPKCKGTGVVTIPCPDCHGTGKWNSR